MSAPISGLFNPFGIWLSDFYKRVFVLVRAKNTKINPWNVAFALLRTDIFQVSAWLTIGNFLIFVYLFIYFNFPSSYIRWGRDGPAHLGTRMSKSLLGKKIAESFSTWNRIVMGIREDCRQKGTWDQKSLVKTIVTWSDLYTEGRMSREGARRGDWNIVRFPRRTWNKGRRRGSPWTKGETDHFMEASRQKKEWLPVQMSR